MAKMLLNQKHVQSCGYVCACGDDRYSGMPRSTKQKIKKHIRAGEKRSWIRNLEKEY